VPVKLIIYDLGLYAKEAKLVRNWYALYRKYLDQSICWLEHNLTN
jgi:hypothetical protein